MTVTLVWSEEDVHWSPKCVNTLYPETAANGVSGMGCAVCVAPIEPPPDSDP